MATGIRRVAEKKRDPAPGVLFTQEASANWESMKNLPPPATEDQWIKVQKIFDLILLLMPGVTFDRTR